MSFLSKNNSFLSLLGSYDFSKPTSYDTLRPHHLLVLYTTISFLKTTKVYKYLTESILSLASKGTDLAIPFVYTGPCPDFLIRLGIRIRCRDHLHILKEEGAEADHTKKMKIIEGLKTMTTAIATDEANDQHYERLLYKYDAADE